MGRVLPQQARSVVPALRGMSYNAVVLIIGGRPDTSLTRSLMRPCRVFQRLLGPPGYAGSIRRGRSREVALPQGGSCEAY
jgi:hypothetical protein